jgi:hypothetical protein
MKSSQSDGTTYESLRSIVEQAVMKLEIRISLMNLCDAAAARLAPLKFFLPK